MLFSTTSSSLQGNKYHNKNSSCVWWRCQDFQWIITKWYTTSGSYCPTGFVFIILRFRIHQVCFTADIAKMYRQIFIHPQDRNLQRILWRYFSKEPIQEYRLTTVTYGTSSAPFLATRCLKKLADDIKCQYPRTAKVLSSDFYVDELLSGTSTIEDAIKVQQEISSLLQTGGFTLRNWDSNHSTFMDSIPRELQKKQ